MLEHFGVLAGVRAALAREAEAGQELLAQGRARLQRYRQEASTQLQGTRDELARLRTRLEAAHQDVLQWVRGMWGAQGAPGRGAGLGCSLWAELRIPTCPRNSSSAMGRIHSRVSLAWLGVQKDTGQWPGVHSVPQESCWTHIQSTAMQKTLLLGQIRLAVQNLFQQITAELKIPMDQGQEDTKAQLDMVSRTLSSGQGGACPAGTRPGPWPS
uniref:Uncharacterized protein n=1 Tax=Cyanistes caeruleus TaxID=156563 RepID=A0A8C0VLE8_CYACU